MPDPDRRPALSLVVPIYNVADYLADCLDSILGQDFRDFEVVLVDDASPDDSAIIAAAYAERDPRCTLVRLPVNGGLGAARNAGLPHAHGRYLMFVDSDDQLVDGALRAIADRIDEAHEPDVVMFAFARSYPDGRIVPDARSRLLAPPAVTRLQDHRDLLRVIPSAWNKAYRRGFVEEQGFRFPTGVYEDIPWSYPVLMTATSVATLGRVCYLYRQRPTTSLLRSSGLAHLDLISQYDRVFAYLDSRPDLEVWRPAMVDRMAWHVPTVLENSSRIPARDRRTFFTATVAGMRRNRPRGYLPAGRLGLKVWLLEHSGYRAFRAAQVVNQARRRLRRARA